MSIAPRIVRRGVTTAPASKEATSPAADLAADLNNDSAVVETPAEEAVADEEPQAEVAEAAPAEENKVAAALDKAAKEAKEEKKLSPLPKKVKINRQKEEKAPEKGTRITRDYFFRWLQEKLVAYPEMDFSGINLAQTRRLWEYLEESIGKEIIDQFEIFLFGMMFKHKETKGSFREPNDSIFYSGPHLEVVAKKIFKGLDAVVKIEDNKIKVGTMKDGQFVEDKELAKAVVPAYKEHLQRTNDRLKKDFEKAEARANKITERAGFILEESK